MYAKLSKCEF
jgi:hypothetical protein